MLLSIFRSYWKLLLPSIASVVPTFRTKKEYCAGMMLENVSLYIKQSDCHHLRQIRKEDILAMVPQKTNK